MNELSTEPVQALYLKYNYRAGTGRDGLLYFTEDGADSIAKQWIVDKESQMKVITSCHDQKLGESRCFATYFYRFHMFLKGGGHFGRDKTLQKICSRFFLARYDQAY